MATQGPTATTYDASSFTNTKAWAGSVTGINAALAAFGWVQTSDSNQIDWTNATVAPFASSVYPNNVLATNATAAGPIAPYLINLRGNWVSGTTYNYLDVVRSTVGGGGTGNDYILSRTPFIITNVAVTAGVATITCPNNLTAGEVVIFPHIQIAGFLLYDPRQNNTFTVLASGLSAAQFQINVAVETYPSTAEGAGNTTSSPSMAVIQVTSTTRPETDTKNYIPYYYEIWKTADTQTFSITNVSRSAGGLATFTGSFSAGSSQFKAGYNIVISGLTNVPSLNGTWCINSATSTQLTVQTGGGTIGSTADSGTATYTMQPIYLRLEYYNNTANVNAPWIRVAVGTGADGNGNLTGNRTASDTCAAAGGVAGFGVEVSTLLSSSSNPQMDLRGTASPTNPTSVIWRNIWSGANNRFGTAMFYNRNDTNAAMLAGGSIMWIIERGIDSAGNYTDDYFTAIYGNGGNTQVTAGAPCLIRYYLKPNPNVAITQVQVDGSNNVTITYSTNQGFSFAVGSIVYFQNLQTATFLNNQLIRVVSVTSNTITGVIAAHAAYGPLSDSGRMIQSISLSTLTPIVGTGGVSQADYYIPTVRTNQATLTVNGNTPLLPVHPIPGYVANPMTMAMSVMTGDAGAHDTTTTITLYGVTRTYYQPQGANVTTTPYAYFGNGNQSTAAMYLRWD